MKTFPIVKNPWLCSLLLAVSLLASQATWAQCPNDNTPANSIPDDLTCSIGLQQIGFGIHGGQYLTVNVVSGNAYTFETCGLSDAGFDTEMTLYKDSDGTLLGHNDDACGTDSRVVLQANFTGVVRVLIDASGCASNTAETGVAASCLPLPPSAPANDLCANAAPLACGDIVNGTTVLATFTPSSVPICNVTGSTSPDVWYSFVGDGSDATVSTCAGGNMDTKLRVFTGTCTALTCVASNDNACGVLSEVTFTTTAGTAYLINIAGNPGQTGNFTISLTCSAPPPACTINVQFFGNPSPCNDNGTPNDPSDDFYTQNVNASFFNRPTTGSLQIVPGGDVIGTYSILVQNIVGNAHTFTGVKFRADGNQTDVQMNFTDEPTCIDGATRSGVAPCSTSPPACTINVQFFGNPSPCNDNGTPNDPSDDFYTQNVNASFFNRPTTGSLQIVPGGDVIGTYSILVQNIVGNAHTFTGVKFRADGNQTAVEMNFTDEPTCIDGATRAGVASCSGSAPPCEVIGFSFANIGSCDDNGTPSNDADDFFTVDVDVLYSNSIIGAVVMVQGADVVFSPNGTALIGTNLTTTLPGVKFRADGQAVDFVGKVTDILISECSLPGTGPSVGECSNGGPACSISLEFANPEDCNDNGTPNDPSDDFYVLDIFVHYENLPTTGNLVFSSPDLVSSPFAVAVANVASTGSPFGISNRAFKADGQPSTLHAQFSANPACAADVTGFGSEPCVCPQVTFVPGPPPSQTVECDGSGNTAEFNAWLAAGGFAQANPSSGTIVSITHNSPDVTLFCGNVKLYTVLFTFTNDCGNSANIGGVFTILDNTPPTLICPPPVQVSCFEQIPPANTTLVTGVSDACGSTPIVVAHISDASGPGGICDNDFTITRTYRATDDCGNAANCTQTITIRDQTPPTITCAAQTTPINCPATPVFTPPTASDNCIGNVAITFNDVNVPGLCPGTFTRTRTWTATDPCGNTATCARSITVQDVTPPPVPANTASTVACPALATAPVPPVVIDACAGAITPTGPVVTNVPNPLTCEGTRTFTFTFTDCSGNSAQWRHVTTVERQPFFITTPNGTATVACPDLTDVQPTPPVVTSNCGEVLTPVIAVTAKPGCEGNRNWNFVYTDCEGNTATWTFTYTVEYQDFVVPASEVLTVNCPLQAEQPVPPTVLDNCGKPLNMSGPVISNTDNTNGCEASRKFEWTFQDCEGTTHTWSKTFIFQYDADFFVYPDQTDYVSCLIYAQPPLPPTIYDFCGNEIEVTGPVVQESIENGCSGWRKFTFTYSDCSGNTHPWVFITFANDDQPPMGDCVSGTVDITNLSCIEAVPCPDDFDFSPKIAELLEAGNIHDECSGHDLVVELDSWSALWQCADTDGDGVGTFGRTFYFRIADPCGNEMPSLCSVTYAGTCQPIEAFPQDAWGVIGGEPGTDASANTTDLQVISDLLGQGPLFIGGSHRSISLTNAQCVVDLLPGVAYPTILANCQQVNCGGCNPAGTIGMKNGLAGNAIALSLNLRYNVQYNGLSTNALRAQSLDCIDIDEDITYCSENGGCKLQIWETDGTPHEFPYTIGGLIDLANLYLDGNLQLTVGNNGVIASALNSSIEKVNAYWHRSNFIASCDTGAGIAQAIVQGEKALPKQKDKLAEMRLVPNPANREVRFELAKLAENQAVVVEFYNLYGQAVLRQEFGIVPSVSERIALDGLGTGVYFVRVKAGNEYYQQKLFITKD